MSTEARPAQQSFFRGFGCLGVALLLAFSMLVLGVGLFVAGIGWISDSLSREQSRWQSSQVLLDEVVVRGDLDRKDLDKAERIAVIHVEGVIVEGLVEEILEQLDMAIHDPLVKGLVIRIDSPGGTLTAADTLLRRIQLFRDGDESQGISPRKAIVGSIGPIAASGGYFAAMACQPLLAEQHSQTGSIGVYVSFPNLEGIARQWGVGSTLIKQGDIKDSGSPFRLPTPKEKQVWQDLVDEGYQDFLQVVEAGRPHLKGKLLEELKRKALRAGPVGADGLAVYSRYRADGGIWTAKQALEVGLIDEIGDLDDAIDIAADLAGLDEKSIVIEYQRSPSVIDSLLGRDKHHHGDPLFDIPGFEKALRSVAAGPRRWCLAPGYEWEGIQALVRSEITRQKSGRRPNTHSRTKTVTRQVASSSRQRDQR